MNLHSKRPLLLLASAAVLCAAPAFAQTDTPPTPPASQSDAPPPPPPDGGGPGGPRRGGPGHRVEMLQHTLGLTTGQTAQVRSIFATERTQMDALRANNNPTVDRRAQMMAIHQDAEAKIRSLLTGDQIVRYDAMQARMREHRPGGPGSPDTPPPPPPSSNPGQL